MEKLIYDTLVTTAQKGSLIKVLGGIFAALQKHVEMPWSKEIFASKKKQIKI